LDASLLTTVFVLAANTLLRPVVNAINRQPIHESSSEVTYQLCVICDGAAQKQVLSMIDHLLETAKYPLGDMDVEPFGDDEVELTATLLSTSVDADELDRIADLLKHLPYIKQAFWNPSTTE